MRRRMEGLGAVLTGASGLFLPPECDRLCTGVLRGSWAFVVSGGFFLAGRSRLLF
jgi:hypothetical protein